jgi:hypothetical protein
MILAAARWRQGSPIFTDPHGTGKLSGATALGERRIMQGNPLQASGTAPILRNRCATPLRCDRNFEEKPKKSAGAAQMAEAPWIMGLAAMPWGCARRQLTGKSNVGPHFAKVFRESRKLSGNVRRALCSSF